MYFEGDSSNAAYLREVADTIMKRIQQMSGQEYVDEYAVKKRASESEE
jgi:1-acyl-sn-glycerol-3-phosphate acyltransferase